MSEKTTVTQLAPMLTVPDVSATITYFRDRLGFAVNFHASHPGIPEYASVSRDGFAVHLLEGEPPSEPGANGGIHLYVGDVDILYQELRERGAFRHDFPQQYPAIREHPPEDKIYGLRDLIMLDPNGYILCFGQEL